MKSSLEKSPILRKIMVRPCSVTMRYRYLEQSDAAWCDKRCLYHPIYFVPKDFLVLEAIPFVHGSGLSGKFAYEPDDAVDIKEETETACINSDSHCKGTYKQCVTTFVMTTILQLVGSN